MRRTRVWQRWLSLLLAWPLMFAAAAATAESKTFGQEQLDQLLAPIALYPDALLSQMLMASTYPADVAEAAKWSKANDKLKGDEAVKAVADKSWDPSVQSLVAFPQALAMMGDKPDWVRQLGDAFLAQPDDVMDTVQGLRKRAKDQGNLESTEQQKVIVEQPTPQQTVVKIEPANPQVIYVPAYNPTVVYGVWWYPAYPPPFYWVPPPYYGFGAGVAAGIGFGIGIAITDSLWGGVNWGRHDIDIDINKYNNVNIERNKITANTNRVNWQHNAENRKGVPYRDAQSREKYGKQVAGADQRQDFRGKDTQRDASREKAQAALKDRGIDPERERQALREDPQTRERAQQAAQNVDRERVQQASQNFDRDRAQQASQGIDHDRARAAAQNADRERARQAAQTRSHDNAFQGAGNAAATRQAANRGAASHRAMGGGGGAHVGGRRAR